jgi:hypothetical protein
MNDRAPLDAMAALEEARAQLETVLRPDAHWRALGQATLPANRAAHERALAGKPVYHAWKLLGRAIEQLRAEGALGAQGAQGPQGAMAGVPQGDGSTPGAGSPQARQPRLGLREVLERIRVEAPLDSRGPPGGAVADDGLSVPPAAPNIAPAHIDIEEAAVSFVVHETATPAVEDAPPPSGHMAEAEEGARKKAREGGNGADPPATDGSGDEDGTEAEVTMVPRGS